MLEELRVENLLLMDRAELRLGPGLNALTGETGAGKTLLAHALDLLLGGRARSGIVRAGAEEAYVEGVFSASPAVAHMQAIPDGAEEVVLARRVWPDGRTRSYVCGRAATVADLRELGSRLLAFYGQHEHRKLTLSAAQLDVLDAHCGAQHLETRARLGDAHSRVRRLGARVEALRELAGARERELDLLEYELREIEQAGPSEQEAEELAAERDRLRHAETLRSAATAGAEALRAEGGVCELLAHAARQLQPAAGYDSALRALAERVEALRYETEDVGSELHSYLAGVECADADGPGRLEQIEERLELFARLQRKHGGSIQDVLAHAERCRARLHELEHAEVDLKAAEHELARAAAELDLLAKQLSERRARAAPELAAAVRTRLTELAMPEAEFEVELSSRTDGCGPRGADAVELLIAPNPGVRAAPLREIASGGELSRVMLALLSVAHGAVHDPDAAPLLVFDEIDAGIGGHTARAVGEHLRTLAESHQILCITHLPQVAAMASRHFTIAKDTSTAPASTTVTMLRGDDVVGELVRMLGASEGDRAASQHARALLKAA